MVYLMSNMLLADDHQRDKLWKIRTWVEQFTDRFIEIPSKFNHAVDKIIVPRTLKSSLEHWLEFFVLSFLSIFPKNSYRYTVSAL